MVSICLCVCLYVCLADEAEVTEPLNASLKLKSDLAVCSHVELLQQVPLFKVNTHVN